MARGRFISLEGGEGAGKSTQLESLGLALQGRGLSVIATREPGGSPNAEAIRALLTDPPHQAAVRAGAERFTWEANAAALHAHLNALVAR